MPAWESMWASGLRPGQAFDAARVEPALAKLLSSSTNSLPSGRALVPGCGRGYAVAELARHGYDATGLEIAPSAVAAANAYCKEQADLAGKTWKVVEGDFFSHSASYNLIYDCTFLW